jgi:alpha-D-xyloside xylohydrolase
MKFTDGYWGLRDGVRLLSPVAARDVRTDADSVTVFAPCKAITHRGDTLNTPQITLTFRSPIEDVIQVRIVHHRGGVPKGPAYEIRHAEGHHPEIDSHDGTVRLTSGRLSAHMTTAGPWAVEFLYDGKRLTGSGAGHSGYLVDATGGRYVREQLSLSVGECVYGLGERFTPFVKNGQAVDMWNEDGGTSSELAYKNVPFYLSSAGYGVLVAHPERVSFEIASEVVSRAQFSVPGEELEYHLIGGRSPKEVLRRYTELTGRPALPPAWSFGLWLTTSFTTNYDEKTVTGFIDGMKERDIPLHVFHFDCFWMKEFQWCDFEWDHEQFPDPAAILRRLRDRGLKISVWVNPYIAQKSRLFDEGMANGYLVKRPDGSVWQWDRWQAGMGLVDFTNPAAARWYQERLRALLKAGVSCFKTDFGERIPTDILWHDGSDPLRMHNYYPYLYNKAVFEVLEEVNGKGEAVVFARSATAGNQKYPVHWGGDCSATYESMAESLRGGLSLGLSGFGFWSHDISGFEKTATPDLYKRWSAFGLLSSHSRLHGNESYRVPWLFDEEASEVLKHFVRLKCRLMPYLFASAREATTDGLPMMRAMLLEFPQDPTCAYLDRQYMLGQSLLVAPVFNDQGSVCYYLPGGRWTSFLTGEQAEGGAWRTEKHGYLSIPLMVPSNSIIAVGKEERRPDYDFADGVTLHVFGLEEGARVSCAVFSMRAEKELEVVFHRSGRTITVERQAGKKPWTACLRNVAEVSGVTGGTHRSSQMGVVITPQADRVTVSL